MTIGRNTMPLHGIARTIIGPTRVVSDSGNFCQRAMARWNFGFAGLTFGISPGVANNWYSQFNGTASAPHCALKRYVPSLTVDRPMSNSSAPACRVNWIASQYNKTLAHSELNSRIDDAHGSCTMEAVR